MTIEYFIVAVENGYNIYKLIFIGKLNFEMNEEKRILEDIESIQREEKIKKMKREYVDKKVEVLRAQIR